MQKINLFFKRIIDILGSLCGIVILSPILITIVLAIKIDSNGPALFKQKRLGKNGNTFKILKFRTMIVNAENIGDGLTVKSNSDSRITKVGSFLRKTSLDELPQLFNVLVGTMSLVGPRPPVTYFPYDGYDNYPEWAKKRFIFKPGVTGLSQVTVRNSVPWDERIKVDLDYINNFNIIFDIKIILSTFMRVIKPQSIYLTNEDGKNETKN